MKFCCQSFAILASQSGEKGMAVIPHVDEGRRRFYLQSRPFELDVYEFYSNSVDGWPRITNRQGEVRSIGLITNQALKFCPACGKNLDDLIKRDLKGFDALFGACSVNLVQ